MKKILGIFLILVTVFAFAGCAQTQNLTDDTQTKTNPENTEGPVSDGKITFLERETNDVDWDTLGVRFTLDPSFVPLESCPIEGRQEGVEFGETILRNLQNSGRDSDKELSGVTHFLQDDTWIFDYSTVSEGYELIDGGCFSVAVNGKTGEVIAAWAGE